MNDVVAQIIKLSKAAKSYKPSVIASLQFDIEYG